MQPYIAIAINGQIPNQTPLPEEPLRSVEVYTRAMFSNTPGAEEMCLRFNEAQTNLNNISPDRKTYLLTNLVETYGLQLLIVSESAQEKFAISILAILNCQEKESIEHLINKIEDPVNQDSSNYLKKQASKDNINSIKTPNDDSPYAPMSKLRQGLVEGYVKTNLAEQLVNPEKTGAVINAIVQVKSQIASGKGIGIWPLEPTGFTRLDPNTLCKISACRTYPMASEEYQNELQAKYKEIQRQFTSSESPLIQLLTNNKQLTKKLSKKQREDFPATLTTLSENKTTLKNDACVLYCQAARDSDLMPAIKDLGLDPKHIDWLAKENLNMNFLDTSQLSEFTNDTLNGALRESDQYPRDSFFSSDIYKADLRREARESVAALAAEWLMSQDSIDTAE